MDRFQRIVDQRWINGSNVDVDRYKYGYDRNGNRLFKENVVIASLSEVYTYDDLNQIATYKLGTLNSGKTDVTGTPTNAQSWDYDAVGNWDSVTTNSATQTRGANRQNEITSVSGATAPTYDSNGNLTKDENDYRFVWDAWNMMVQVKNSSNVVIITYGRDALHRHVTDTVSSSVTDRFFSLGWQLLETKTGSNTVTRNVWSPAYVDALVLRDRDTDSNGTLDERIYPLQDANWNTTALVTTSGTIVERETYNPFGVATYRDASGAALSGSSKDWVFLHQGGEKIAAGDYEFRNRVHSPTLGRWLTNDPLGFAAGDVNTFRSFANNPITIVDPSGLDISRSELVSEELDSNGMSIMPPQEIAQGSGEKDLLDYSANFFAGWADNLTFDVTKHIRDYYGINDGINFNGGSYRYGEATETLHSTLIGAGGGPVSVAVPKMAFQPVISGGGTIALRPAIQISTTQVPALMIGGGVGILHAVQIPGEGDEKTDRSPYPIGKRKYFNTRKEAKEAARRAGGGNEPVNHPDGEHGPHFHPGNGKGKPLNHDHYYYPKHAK